MFNHLLRGAYARAELAERRLNELKEEVAALKAMHGMGATCNANKADEPPEIS